MIEPHLSGGLIPVHLRTLLHHEGDDLVEIGDRGDIGHRDRSLVSKVAQTMGRAEFLLPEGTMVPESGLPPVTIRSAM